MEQRRRSSFFVSPAEKFTTAGNGNVFQSIRQSENIYYNMYAATNRRWTGMITLLLRWKQSVFSLIWSDVLVFLLVYYFMMILYECVLKHYPEQREIFEMICIYADRFKDSIPITFLIGFWVSQIVNRWWDQFMALPDPDSLALKLVAFIPGGGEYHRNLRRAIMRYVNLSCILALRLIAVNVHNRFPTYASLVNAKLLLPSEAEKLENVDSRTPHESSWAPLLWAMKLVTKAKNDNKINIDPPSYAQLQANFEKIEIDNRKLLRYSWINFPLSYTQVANLAVLTYYVSVLFSRQFLDPHGDLGDHKNPFTNTSISYSSTEPFKSHTPGLYFPLFAIIEIICYMGWVKVALSLLNPFGDDDDDFEVNYLIDRNLQVSYLIVDQAEDDIEVVNDPFLEAGIQIPSDLPYQEEAPELPNARKTPIDNTAFEIYEEGRDNCTRNGIN